MDDSYLNERYLAMGRRWMRQLVGNSQAKLVMVSESLPYWPQSWG